MNKAKYKLNWFDAVVAVLLVVTVLGVCWVVLWREPDEITGDEQVTLRYVVRVSGLREELADAVTVGDTVRDGSGLRVIGTVTGSQTDAATYFSERVTRPATDENGNVYLTPVASPMPGKVDLYVTVETEATVTGDGRYYVAGEAVSVGTYAELMTRHFWGVGYCVSVTEAE